MTFGESVDTCEKAMGANGRKGERVVGRGYRLKATLGQLASVAFVAVALFFSSCVSRNSGGESATPGAAYAQGFAFVERGGELRLAVYAPTGGKILPLMEYRRGDSLIITDSVITIREGVHRVVCFSSTHVGFLVSLGCGEEIVGVSMPKYISSELVREGVEAGRIRDVGSDMNLDYETLLSLKPDLVLAYSLSEQKPEFIDRLTDLGIPVVMVGEYQENTPLARAEWIRAIGWLVNRVGEADARFAMIRQEYDRLCRLTQEVEHRPAVLLNVPWQESWFVPGNRGFMSQFLRDAGAYNVLGEVFDDAQSHSIHFEQVLAKGLDAEFWLNPGTCNSLQELTGLNEHYEEFFSVREGKVYNNTQRTNAWGGNDFWESGVVHPEVVLHDLVAIFHPELVGADTSLRYYKHLR